MDMEKKKGGWSPKRRLLCLALVLVAVLFVSGIGGAFGLLKDSTAGVTAEYKLATVSCEVAKDTTAAVSTYTVKNTGDTAAFFRAVIVMNWVDDYGNVVYISPEEVTLPTITPYDGWTSDGSYYYYTTAVKPGESCTFFWVPIPEGTAYKLQITVLADAIQSEPAAAAAEAWGFTPGSSEQKSSLFQLEQRVKRFTLCSHAFFWNGECASRSFYV